MCERKRDFLRVFIMLHAILWRRAVWCGLCVKAALLYSAVYYGSCTEGVRHATPVYYLWVSINKPIVHETTGLY